MDGDREVVTPEVAAARAAQKKNKFSIFKSKSRAAADASAAAKALNKAAPSRNTPTPSSSKKPSTSTPVEEYDEDLPERLPLTSPSHSRTPSLDKPGESSSPGSSKIPAKAGFDFKAIGKVIGQDDLDPSSLSIATPSPRVPGQSPTIPRIALDRSESVPPATSQYPDRNADEARTPRARSTALPEGDSSPHLTETLGPTEESVADLRASFQRSLSMNDAANYQEDDSQTASSSSAPPPPSKDFISHSNSRSAPSWPPPSSMLSYASSDGSAWSSTGTSLDYSSTTFGTTNSASGTGSIGPLRRQAPPALSFESYNTFNPTSPIPPSSIPSNPFASSSRASFSPSDITPTSTAPQLSFGSMDGNVIPLTDAERERERNAWAPAPIGLAAAIASANSGLASNGKSKSKSKGVSSYTLNPWET